MVIFGSFQLSGETLKDRLVGKFIVLDGPDGCGKSTQVKLLVEWLEKQGVDSAVYRDPGTTAIGEKIRQILLNPEHAAMTAETEVLLYMAARVQLWHEEIGPALGRGKCVILDRWLTSTCAYQGWAGGFGITRVVSIARDCMDKPWPDLTVILDVDLGTAAKRMERDLDRMEQKGQNYHQKVRGGFLRLSEQLDNVVVVDAGQRIEQVHKSVTKAVTTVLTTE